MEVDVAPEVRALSGELLPQADELGRLMAERILAETPYYAEGHQVGLEELVISCTQNLTYVLGTLAGDRRVSVDTPRRTGTTRAEQGVPYAAVLQAFRVGGRFVWELMVERSAPQDRDVLLLAASDIWSVSDDLAAQVTDAYRAALAERVRRDAQVRAALVSGLLDGDAGVSDETWSSADDLAFRRDGEFVVVSAWCEPPGAEALPEVERALERRNVTSAWRLDQHHQDGLVSLRPGFGIDRLLALLAEVGRERAGVSPVFARVEDAVEATRQARVACAAATPGSRDLVRYDEQPVAVLIARNLDQAEATARAVLGPVLALPDEDRDVLLATARAWLACAGSTSAAADRLHLHRNSVRYRLGRLEELTGRALADPVGAAELHVALEAARITGLDT